MHASARAYFPSRRDERTPGQLPAATQGSGLDRVELPPFFLSNGRIVPRPPTGPYLRYVLALGRTHGLRVHPLGIPTPTVTRAVGEGTLRELSERTYEDAAHWHGSTHEVLRIVLRVAELILAERLEAVLAAKLRRDARERCG